MDSQETADQIRRESAASRKSVVHRVGSRPRPLQVKRQQAFQNLLIAHIVRPARDYSRPLSVGDTTQSPGVYHHWRGTERCVARAWPLVVVAPSLTNCCSRPCSQEQYITFDPRIQQFCAESPNFYPKQQKPRHVQQSSTTTNI